MRIGWAAAILSAACVWGMPAWAQSSSRLDNQEIAKETQNPVSHYATLPLRYTVEGPSGADDSIKKSYEINHAIVPVKVSDDWNVITRTKLTLVSQPSRTAGGQRTFGLDNGYTEFYLSPEQGDDGLYWGLGPLLYYPATNANLGPEKWGTGPAAALVRVGKEAWLWGVIAKNTWTVGPSDAGGGDTNEFSLNPFASYNFKDGWSLGTSPTFTADWQAASNQRWTVPVGASVGKAFRLLDQPARISVDSYYNAVRPDSRQESWNASVTVKLLFAR